MKYLLKVQGKLYGYDNPSLILINMKENKFEDYEVELWKKDENKMVLSYSPLGLAELRLALNQEK